MMNTEEDCRRNCKLGENVPPPEREEEDVFVDTHNMADVGSLMVKTADQMECDNQKQQRRRLLESPKFSSNKKWPSLPQSFSVGCLHEEISLSAPVSPLMQRRLRRNKTNSSLALRTGGICSPQPLRFHPRILSVSSSVSNLSSPISPLSPHGEDLRKETWEEGELDNLFVAATHMDMDDAAMLFDPFSSVDPPSSLMQSSSSKTKPKAAISDMRRAQGDDALAERRDTDKGGNNNSSSCSFLSKKRIDRGRERGDTITPSSLTAKNKPLSSEGNSIPPKNERTWAPIPKPFGTVGVREDNSLFIVQTNETSINCEEGRGKKKIKTKPNCKNRNGDSDSDTDTDTDTDTEGDESGEITIQLFEQHHVDDCHHRNQQEKANKRRERRQSKENPLDLHPASQGRSDVVFDSGVDSQSSLHTIVNNKCCSKCSPSSFTTKSINTTNNNNSHNNNQLILTQQPHAHIPPNCNFVETADAQ
eukprot:m.73581 g.73581  ORF g.73581 m.73581 type:complete len:476 (-) comp11776_c1_seq2:25-1452(-)